MKAPNFLNGVLPSRRRAARERQQDYKLRFDELQKENAERVRRMSQLRGDIDPADFLYDSAYGTGAAASRHSLHETAQPRRPSGQDPLPAEPLTASTTGSSASSSNRSTPASSTTEPDPPSYEAPNPSQRPRRRARSTFRELSHLQTMMDPDVPGPWPVPVVVLPTDAGTVAPVAKEERPEGSQ